MQIKPQNTTSYPDKKKCGSYKGEGDCYNREHSVPQSWFNKKSPMVSDAFHVVPTDGYVNNRRSNYPFGEVGSASWTSTNGSKVGSAKSGLGTGGTVFEPIDAYKGDFARSYLYMATRYMDQCNNWTGGMFGSQELGFKTWAINMLLKWHRNDPVSQKEINRNNEIHKNQQNRNPFIDYPELAEYIWGDKKGQIWNIGSGIDDIFIDFEIYPNPASEVLNIRTEETALQYRIYALNGQIVLSGMLENNTIYINQLNNGMYLIELSKEGKRTIHKFIVN